MGRQKVLVVMAGGGHGFQTRRLVQGLGEHFDYAYILPSDSSETVLVDLPDGDVFYMEPTVRFMEEGAAKKLLRILRAFWKAAQVTYRSKTTSIVAVGTAAAVPVMFWGRLFGKRTIFVESITRINDLSRTARLLARYRLCSRLYAQWPELAKVHPRLRYKGVVV